MPIAVDGGVIYRLGRFNVMASFYFISTMYVDECNNNFCWTLTASAAGEIMRAKVASSERYSRVVRMYRLKDRKKLAKRKKLAR